MSGLVRWSVGFKLGGGRLIWSTIDTLRTRASDPVGPLGPLEAVDAVDALDALDALDAVDAVDGLASEDSLVVTVETEGSDLISNFNFAI